MKIRVDLLKHMANNNIRQIKELHELTGLSRVTIHKILSGKTKGLSFSTICTLCEKLNCEPGELVVLVSDEEAS